MVLRAPGRRIDIDSGAGATTLVGATLVVALEQGRHKTCPYSHIEEGL
jgi:hypothetical protein